MTYDPLQLVMAGWCGLCSLIFIVVASFLSNSQLYHGRMVANGVRRKRQGLRAKLRIARPPLEPILLVVRPFAMHLFRSVGAALQGLSHRVESMHALTRGR